MPPGAPRSVQPAGTCTVESSCSTIAGPGRTVAEDGRRAAAAGTRRVYHGGWREWTAVGRDALAQHDTIAAETIIEQEDATVVIPPGWSGRVGAAGTLVLQRGAD